MSEENIGYNRAINLAKSELENKNPEDIVNNTKAIWNGTTFEIPWFTKNIELEKGKSDEQIIWLHYLNAMGAKKLSNIYINYKQVPGGIIYNDNFIKRCLKPLLKKFAHDLDLFIKTGEKLGGIKQNLGHASFTLYPLPYIPLTFIIWEGDDEIPANGNVLYDQTITSWLCAEDIVVISEQAAYKLIQSI